MRLRDIVSRIFIDPRKLTMYALNPDNLRGKNKAIIFQQYLGFTPKNYPLLLTQIQEKVMDAQAVPGILDRYGQRYSVDLLIMGVEPEQKAIVRTGWIVNPEEEDLARLTTVYIRRKR